MQVCFQKVNSLKGFEDFYLKDEARIWPGLSYMCHIRPSHAGLIRGNQFSVRNLETKINLELGFTSDIVAFV